ncbi:MAG TPA: hypothetical protein VGA13_04435 [Acidimicrobiales bacterium]
MTDVDENAALPRAQHARAAGLIHHVIATMVIVGVIVTVVAALLGVWFLGPPLAVATVAIAARRTASGADDRLVSSLSARPVTAADQPRLVNLVEGLCVAAGVHRPRIMMVDHEVPNIGSVGDSHHGVIVVTSSLLDTVSRVELEGLVAREVSRLRAGVVADIAQAAAFSSWPGSGGPQGGGAESVALADVDAVRLTRYPPGLANALEAIAGKATDADPPGHPDVPAIIWLHSPGRLTHDPAVPSLADRIATLREL